MPPSTPAEIYARFAALPGSGQIASVYACEGLREWCQRHSYYSLVAEVGSGIGTLTQILLDYTNAIILFVEDDPVCLESLMRNLHGDLRRLIRIEPSALRDVNVDLLVVDGDQLDVAHVPLFGPIFVEGGRREWRTRLEMRLEEEIDWCYLEHRPLDRTKGFHLYFPWPTLTNRMLCAFMCWMERISDIPARLQGRPVGKRRR